MLQGASQEGRRRHQEGSKRAPTISGKTYQTCLFHGLRCSCDLLGPPGRSWRPQEAQGSVPRGPKTAPRGVQDCCKRTPENSETDQTSLFHCLRIFWDLLCPPGGSWRPQEELKLGQQLGIEINIKDPTVPWLVDTVGWMITKFQPRSHDNCSHEMLHDKEHQGEIAEFGGQIWYRMADRIAACRGKWEAILPEGIWVGKSDIDDAHSVVDIERGLRRIMAVRMMPEEFRWNAELLEGITVAPWTQTAATTVTGTVGRSMYITERMIDAHGPTDDCRKCNTGYGSHSPARRQRFEAIQADLLREKLEQSPEAAEATVVAPAAGTPAPGAASRQAAGSGQAAVVPAPPQAEDSAMPDAGAGEVTGPVQEVPEGGLRDEAEALIRGVAPGAPRSEEEIKKPRVAAFGTYSVCELAACEEGYDENFDP